MHQIDSFKSEILSVTICLIMASCSSTMKQDVDTRDQFIPVTQVTPRDTVVEREYIGDIHAFRKTEIRSRVQGYLDKIFVDEGQEVKEGQLLFQINAEEYIAKLREAKATLASAMAEARTTQLQFEQVKLLVDKGVISLTELEVAKARNEAFNARVEEARSSVASASLKVENTAIRSPFAGTIDRIPFKIGSLIDEGILLTTISDVRFIYAYFNVSENEYLAYMENKLNRIDNYEDEAELVLADGSIHKQKGKIETMDGEFESTTGTIAFRALFPNPDKILKHGASGKVRLMTAIKNALIIPQKSTFEIQDKSYVYVVDKNNEVKMQSFTPMMRLSHFYIIEEGLESGDKIVYEGLQNMKEGMKISPTTVPLDSLMLLAQDRIPDSDI